MEMLGGRETFGGPLGAESNVHGRSSRHSEASVEVVDDSIGSFLGSYIKHYPVG